jgi:hypothetical protein
MSGRALLVALVLAALAVGAWIAVRARPAASDGRVVRQPLFAVDEIPVEQVDRLELERPGAPTLAFVRSADGWSQSAPFAHPADAAAIRMVIDAFASLESTRAVDPSSLDPEARVALGMDPARARVTVAWPGGSRTVVLGRRTVAGRAWARVDGRADAASVDAGLHAIALEDDPRQWRSSRLHDAASADVARLELRYGPAPGQQLVLARTGGAWRSETPFATRIDAEAVRGYLDALLRANADAFVADEPQDLAAFGLASPERSVRLRASGDPAPGVGLVEVGVPVAEGAQERFGRIDGRPAVVQLGPRALAALFPPPAFFIDARGCAAVPADVRRIEFTPPEGSAAIPWAVERSLDAWTLGVGGAADATGAVPADRERVRRLLAQLCEARAPAIAFQQAPKELVLGTFRLIGAGDLPIAEVRIAREQAGQWALDGLDGVLRVHPPGFDVATDPAAYAGNR